VGKNVSADFKPGVHKSWAADRRDVSVFGRSIELASCFPSGALNFELASRFLKNLFSSVVGYFVSFVTNDKMYNFSKPTGFVHQHV
jgi:hypothetical protein